jgi:DNA-binding transcriptional MerR regulator
LSKGPEAFRSISEAADQLGVPQHVLRFWETKFSFIRPMKRAGGRRFYRPQDIAVLAQVRRLLHDQGYTIKGVQKLHRELGSRRFLTGRGEESIVAEAIASEPSQGSGGIATGGRERLGEALMALEAAKARLDELLRAAER